MSATKASVRNLDDIQCDIDFARYEREKVQGEILHALRSGKKVPVRIERECSALDKEINLLEDQLAVLTLYS